jgi:signal transduction histidine kinase
LLFAFYCFTWFLGAGVTGARPLGDWLTWLDWEILHRLGFIIIHVTTGLLVAIINALFPGVLHKYVRVGMYVITAAFTIIAIFIDINLLRATVGADGPAPFIYLAGNAYVIIRFATKLRKINRAQYIFLCGIALFIYITVRDILWHLGGILLPPFGGDGMMVIHEFMIMTAAVVALLMTLCAALAVFLTVSEEVENAKEAERRLSADNAALVRLGQMRTDLIANITHETTTPLAVLSVYADLIADELSDHEIGEQITKDLNTISVEAERIAGLIDELNRHARETDTRLSKASLDLAELLHGATRLYSPIIAGTGSALHVDIPAGLPNIYACAGEISQVLFNLLQNAQKHTEDGEVTVTAHYGAGDFVQISVADTGQGIPPELLPRVFERGVFGTDLKGNTSSGLGLALCKDIIEAHGGTIGIESERGKGTVVRFTLPVWKEGMDA